MKKTLAAILTSAMILGSLTAVSAATSLDGRQTASAHLDQSGNEVVVTVDLSDGWSAEFAPAAVYLYDGPVSEGAEPVAVGLTLYEEVYQGQIAIGEDQKNFRSENGITSYDMPDGSHDYYFEAGENVFFMVTVNKDMDGDAVMERFAVEPFSPTDDEAPGSQLFTHEDIIAATDKVMEEFESWDGCELHDIRYAGDDASSDENLAWLNELNEDAEYTQCMELLMDFHSPTEEEKLEGTAWEPDHEYTDYQWWLARTADGEWTVVTFGY